MVLVRITGGLGNQMFQYAFGVAYAKTYGLPLKLDLSAYDRLKSHNGFELQNVFNTSAEIATSEEVVRLTGCADHRIAKRLNRYLGYRKKTFFIEKDYRHQTPPSLAKGAIYFDGYFQSEKYFDDVADLLREHFSFKPTVDKQTEDLAQQIKGRDSVSLHVRRGDYVLNPQNLINHGVLGLKYYEEAIQKARLYLSDPHFYVFSDDISWCRDNLRLAPNEVTFVSHNQGKKSWQDMRLMSQCRVNILANSSFSWWGSWLAINSVRIAPSPWFYTDKFDDRDLHLPGTIKIPPHFLSPKG